MFHSGLPQHATLAPATYYTSHNEDNGSQSPTKYHENGHDTFSDFVTLVCQEAQSTQASAIHPGHRSPKVTMAPSYFSSSPQVSTESSTGQPGLYPPPPQAPSARPVALIRSSADLPPPSTESGSPPMGNSPMSDAGGQAGHLRLSPLPNQQLGSQASDSVDLPPRTVVSFCF